MDGKYTTVLIILLLTLQNVVCSEPQYVANGCAIDHMEVRQTKVGKGYTLMQVAKHLHDPTFVDPEDAEWACIDGRDKRYVQSTPGGNTGEFIAALAAFSTWTQDKLDDKKIYSLLRNFIKIHFVPEIHYLNGTDRHMTFHHHFASCRQATGPMGEEVTIEYLLNPPAAKQQQLLSLLTTPETGVGCGHLRLMLQLPDQYDVNVEWVRSVLRAFYTLLWDKQAPESASLDLVVDMGNHTEGAVVLVDGVGCGRLSPLVRPSRPDLRTSVFVDHSVEVRSIARSDMAQYFTSQLSPPIPQDKFLAKYNDVADTQLAATLSHLAPELPVYSVVYYGHVV